MPFTFPKPTVHGGFERVSTPSVHWGMVDCGAMVGCMHHCLLGLYPPLKQYYIAKPEKIGGVGGISCEVLGELHNVPVCLGTVQDSGGLFYANFKVVVGKGYSILFGLDFLETIDGHVRIKDKELEY